MPFPARKYARNPHGIGIDYALRRGCWRAHLFVAGRSESRLFKLRREAERWAAKREAELRGGGTAIRFAEVAERWLAQHLPELSHGKRPTGYYLEGGPPC